MSPGVDLVFMWHIFACLPAGSAGKGPGESFWPHGLGAGGSRAHAAELQPGGGGGAARAAAPARSLRTDPLGAGRGPCGFMGGLLRISWLQRGNEEETEESQRFMMKPQELKDQSDLWMKEVLADVLV